MHYRKDGRAKNWKGQNNMLNNILHEILFLYSGLTVCYEKNLH